MAPAAAKIPAVIVGGTLNALGVVRSLAPAGVPIYLLETTRRCVAAWSRYCRFVRTPSLEGESLVEELVGLAKSLQCKPVLFLTSDESVATASTRRALLQKHYRLSLPSHEMVTTLADKSAFHFFAQNEGIPVPRGQPVANEFDIARLGDLEPPMIIKPSDKRLVLSGVAERAVQADTVALAQNAARSMLQLSPRLIAQEWVHGPDSEIYFTLFACDRESRTLGLFSGRKLVCSPPAIGSTALCVPAPEVADVLYPYTLEFIRRTGYQGLGGLEFKRDSRTGQFIVIEPTVGRTDWQAEIATLCGVNLPLLTYLEQVDTPVGVPPVVAKVVAWRASRDVKAPESLDRSTRLIDGILRLADPLPAFYYYLYERFVLRLWRFACRRRRRPPDST